MSGCLGRKSGVFNPFCFSFTFHRESVLSAMLYMNRHGCPLSFLDNNLYFPLFFWASRVLRLIRRVFVVSLIFTIRYNCLHCTARNIMFPYFRRPDLTLFSFLLYRAIIIITCALKLLVPPPTRHRPK